MSKEIIGIDPAEIRPRPFMSRLEREAAAAGVLSTPTEQEAQETKDQLPTTQKDVTPIGKKALNVAGVQRR